MNPKDLVVTAVTSLYSTRDPAILDRYWSINYIQHSSLLPDGLAGARGLTKTLPPTFRYEMVRVFAEDDLVVTHGMYHGFGPQPLVAFDLWRVTDGKIAEHWDALMPLFPQTASGRTQTDGPTAVREPGATAASKALIERFFATVVLGGDFARMPEFFAGDTYAQHNPLVRDGVSGARADLGRLHSEGQGLVIAQCHRMIAEGEFVLTQSAGSAAGQPAAFYDLWRIADGKIAEHWDVWAAIPNELPHSNGLF
jgi:predicted SnoaL-like aldol condensation-catalyzing enzyme